MTFYEEEIAYKAAELIEKLQKENKDFKIALSDIQAIAIDPLVTEVNRLQEENKKLRGDLDVARGFSGITDAKRLQEENERLQHLIRIRDADCAALQRSTYKLQEENEELQEKNRELQKWVHAYADACGFHCRNNQSLREENEELQREMVYQKISRSENLRKKDEEIIQLRRVIDDRQNLVSLLKEKDKENKKLQEENKRLTRDLDAARSFSGITDAKSLREEIEKLQEIIHSYEATCSIHRQNNQSLREEIKGIEDRADLLYKQLLHERKG